MKMWAGRPAGLANIADGFALPDASTLANSVAEAREVGIQGGVLIVVLEDDYIAVTILFADKIHRGIGCRPDRGAGGGGIINALVGAPSLQDGVEASAETGADSGKLKRRTKKGFLQGFSVRSQVAASVVALRVPECSVHLSGVDEFRRDDPPAARRLSFLVTCFVGD